MFWRTMLIKLNDLLMERVDFLELANGIAKAHGVKPKIKFKKIKGGDLAHYNVDTNAIAINPTGKLRDFLESILHELHHAMEAKRMGKSKYKKAYEMEMARALSSGQHQYDDNHFEIRAEKWAQRNAPRWIKKLNLK